MGSQRQFHSKTFQPKSAPPIQTASLTPRPFGNTHDTPTSALDDTPNLQAQLDLLRRRPSNLHRITPDIPKATIQPKLTVGAPNDQYEQEADRVADQVMSMPDAATQAPVQREGMPEEDELQTKPLAAAITPLVQREAMPEEEEVQTKAIASIQREEMPEEEELQMKPIGMLQREEAMPEEEEVQAKPLGSSIQREAMPEEEELQAKPLGNGTLQREEMPEEEEAVQAKGAPDAALPAGSNLESRLSSSQGSGSPLSNDVRSFMEPRFGADFSQVRVHTGSEAVQMNRDLHAQAFTHKQDVYFGAGKAPAKDALTAHELTHVVQQVGGVQTKLTQNQPDIQQKCSACETEDTTVRRKEGSNAQVIQRKIGDGYDLTSPRFAGDPVLEACFDNEHRMLFGETGSAVEKVQQALTDSGLPLKVDGIFGAKTQAAVAKFKLDNGITPSSGVVGPQTMAELNQRFSTEAPPQPAKPPTKKRRTPQPPTTDKARQKKMDKARVQSKVTLQLAITQLEALKAAFQSGLEQDLVAHQKAINAVTTWLKANPNESDYLGTLAKATNLMNQNLNISPPVVYGPPSKPPCSNPQLAYAWTVAKSNIFCCDLFFVSGQNCQRDVVTHEAFHVVGLGHGEDKQGKPESRESMTTEQALNSSDSMAQLVSELATGGSDACGSGK